jgi:alpha-glucosidase
MNEMAARELRTVPREWWRGSVIYQIYPRSFADSNGDGIGDLAGITARLDHIASLGVDGVWLSPFFTSPMRDFGYDVADFCGVDPIFGTLDDFDALIARAHELGLKVIIDQVWSHSSDQHAWFKESRADRTNAKSDWYVWADPKADGSPPNNWQSVFGGPAWTWDARRCQYYLHNFLREQPDLNFHNPAVQEAVLATAQFWLDRGVDGFRLDALNFSMHDPLLRDNPPAPDTGRPRTRSFDFQRHIFNQSHPAIPRFLERIRALTDRYGDRFTVAEVGGPTPEPEMHAFTQGDARLNSAYGFNFLYAERLAPSLVRDAVAEWPAAPGVGWPSWAFENHDAPRALSRWIGPEDRARFARVKMLLLMCLRGNVFLYQGEELGLTQVEIGYADLQDPEAITNWPLTLSRDGARTPMPWTGDAHAAGFTSGRPWLPLGIDHASLAVDRQDKDPESLLNVTRRVVALRADNVALAIGTMTVTCAEEALLVFVREGGGQSLTCAFNLGDTALDWAIDEPKRYRVVESVNGATHTLLPPYSGVVLERIA